MLGQTLFRLGEFALAQEHLDEGVALYDPQQHRSYGTLPEDPGVDSFKGRDLMTLQGGKP
jgi:hypothetical protein